MPKPSLGAHTVHGLSFGLRTPLVYISIILVNYFFIFKSYSPIIKIFVARFKFFGILIKVKYLWDSLPSPTLPLNFWHFAGTDRFDRVSRYFLLSFRLVVLFSSTSPWSTSVLFFSNSTISMRCIFKSSKHFSRTFGLCKSDFNSFKSSLPEALFVFFWEILHWYFIKAIRYIANSVYVVYFIFLKCSSSFTSIWWISFDDINIYFEKVGTFICWSKWFPGYIISPDVKLFTKNNSSSCLILSFKISPANDIFRIQWATNLLGLFWSQGWSRREGLYVMIDIDYLISWLWVCS